MLSLYIGADVKSTRANIAPKRPSITRSLFRRPPAIEHTFGIPKPRTTGAGGAPAREIPVDQTAWNVHDTNMWPSIALFLFIVAYRTAPLFLPEGSWNAALNISPVSAVALCGAVYFRGHTRWLVPFSSLFAADFLLNTFAYHIPVLSGEMLVRYCAVAAVSALGFMVRKHAESKVRIPSLLLASAFGSFIFYITTNTAAWAANPAYAPTLEGLLQSLTSGLPGYPSTLWFYRQTLIGDMLFTLILAASVTLANSRAVGIELSPSKTVA
jgi:hypothetical protein